MRTTSYRCLLYAGLRLDDSAENFDDFRMLPFFPVALSTHISVSAFVHDVNEIYLLLFYQIPYMMVPYIDMLGPTGAVRVPSQVHR